MITVFAPVVIVPAVRVSAVFTPVMFTRAGAVAVVSVGLLVTDGMVRSSPVTGVPCGFQFSGVVHTVEDAPVQVRASGPVLISRSLLKLNDPADPGVNSVR